MCSPGCPGTCSADQAGLKLRDSPACASQVLGLIKSVSQPPGLYLLHVCAHARVCVCVCVCTRMQAYYGTCVDIREPLAIVSSHLLPHGLVQRIPQQQMPLPTESSCWPSFYLLRHSLILSFPGHPKTCYSLPMLPNYLGS